jgi:geranylgeranyl pyrophosphate synthase
VNYEKDLNKKESVISVDYEKLSDFKAAFGKIAIDSLFVLDKNIEFQKCLLESHKHFSVAYQLNDDVLDFEKDFKNNQFNWLIYKYTKEYDLKEYSINDLKKL